MVGVNLAVALCPTDTLAGTLLSRVRQVVSSRRGLMIEGVATLRGEGIRYRAVLPPLSEDGATIDHVLGAMNYRALRTNEVLTTQVNFRRLPMAPRERQRLSTRRLRSISGSRADVIAVEMQKIENKKHQSRGVARIRRGLDHAERAAAIRTHAAQLAVEIGLRQFMPRPPRSSDICGSSQGRCGS